MPEWDDDEDQYSSDSELVKQLRKQLRDAKKANEGLESEVSTLRPQVRKNAISGILSSLEVNPKIAALLPSDLEVSKESVETWLAEYGDVFNVKKEPPVETKTEGDKPAETVDTNVFPPEMREAWARMQGGESTAGAVAPDKEQQEMARLGDAATKSGGSFDNFVALLRNEAPPRM